MLSCERERTRLLSLGHVDIEALRQVCLYGLEIIVAFGHFQTNF
jgi:hypothetical protein